MKGQERRRMQRRRLLFNLEVRDRVDDSLFGHVGDLHTRGLSILRPAGSASHALGEELALAVLTPALGEEPARRLELDVVVRWCGPDENPALVNVGCELVDPGRGLAAAISQVVQRFDFET
jgi:hypothetical protein